VKKAILKIPSSVLVLLLLLSCSNQVIDQAQIQNREGVYDAGEESQPFSGKATRFYPNGLIKSEHRYIRGQENGKQRQWYDNGQLKEQAGFKDGVPHGTHKSWGSNGVLLEEMTYDNGLRVQN
jgi:antitoxin component YwqK of YwqJK toxin-antitoxin module